MPRPFLFAASLLATAALAVLAPSPARADAPPAPDAEIAKLLEARGSLKWNHVPLARGDRYGHAEVLVAAPLAKVRSEVTAYGTYKTLVPRKFNNARVVGKTKAGTDVYMQVPVLKGMITLWQVMRFGQVRRVADGVEQLEGTYVDGNVRTAHVVFTLRRVDAATTQLKMDLLIAPTFAAPQSALDEELRDAAMQAVDALRDRAQPAPGPVLSLAAAAAP